MRFLDFGWLYDFLFKRRGRVGSGSIALLSPFYSHFLTLLLKFSVGESHFVEVCQGEEAVKLRRVFGQSSILRFAIAKDPFLITPKMCSTLLRVEALEALSLSHSTTAVLSAPSAIGHGFDPCRA